MPPSLVLMCYLISHNIAEQVGTASKALARSLPVHTTPQLQFSALCLSVGAPPPAPATQQVQERANFAKTGVY